MTANATTKAQVAVSTAIDFLAAKHGVAREEIIRAINEKQPKVCAQFAELISEAVKAA